MHILITNDDGPPSNQSSPYIHSFVQTLQAAGHTVSVVLPDTQRSWIGKAHLVGQSVTPTYFRPGPLRRESSGGLNNQGVTTNDPLPRHALDEEWVLINSTPASCVQIGLHHYFQDRGPIDLVVSGPNYGRNTTAVFALSSGTLGGALEAAVCGKRAIALSYAFFDRNHDPDIIAGASQMSVKVIEYLAKNWKQGVQLYNVNVPLVADVVNKKVVWTPMLLNTWTPGLSAFKEVDQADEAVSTSDAAEVEIRQGEEQAAPGSTKAENVPAPAHARYQHKHFKWAPEFKDVFTSVEKGGPGSDGWVVKEGMTSVTPLIASFAPVPGFEGEIAL